MTTHLPISDPTPYALSLCDECFLPQYHPQSFGFISTTSSSSSSSFKKVIASISAVFYHIVSQTTPPDSPHQKLSIKPKLDGIWFGSCREIHIFVFGH